MHPGEAGGEGVSGRMHRGVVHCYPRTDGVGTEEGTGSSSMMDC